MLNFTRIESLLFVAALVITLTLGAFNVPELPAVAIGVAPLAALEIGQVVATARRIRRNNRRALDSNTPKDSQ